jgi:hypothetical protein
MPTVIPPWLNVGPQNILQAAQAGAELGSKVGAEQQRARNEAAERQAAAERLAAQLAQERRALAVNANLKAREIEASQQERMARLSQDKELNEQRFKLDEAAGARAERALKADEAQKLWDREQEKTKLILDAKASEADAAFARDSASGMTVDEAIKRNPLSPKAQSVAAQRAIQLKQESDTAAQRNAKAVADLFPQYEDAIRREYRSSKQLEVRLNIDW